MRAAAVVVLAYLIGSIPFGYLIVRGTSGADIRETGSGGTGATNVSRRAGKKAGIATLILDALKGVTAVLVARLILGLPLWSDVGIGDYSANAHWWVAAAAIAVLVGHIFPIWLRFRGGKGVATAVGIFLILAPVPLLLTGVIFIGLVWWSRYVSLGSIVAAAALPVLIWFRKGVAVRGPLDPVLLAASVAACLIVFAHRENIKRLIAGTENKFS